MESIDSITLIESVQPEVFSTFRDDSKHLNPAEPHMLFSRKVCEQRRNVLRERTQGLTFTTQATKQEPTGESLAHDTVSIAEQQPRPCAHVLCWLLFLATQRNRSYILSNAKSRLCGGTSRRCSRARGIQRGICWPRGRATPQPASGT
jgi:hypothetical protein